MKQSFISVRKLLLSIALVVVSAAPAHAVIALDSTRGDGNQAWQGALGMDFNVLSPILITHLGAFDDDQNGFNNGAIQVGIFNRNTGLLALPLIGVLTGTAQPLTNQNRFVDIVDQLLAVGQYSIVAVGFDSIDENGNVGLGGAGPTIDTGGGLISFVGGARFDPNQTGALFFPTTLDGGPANRYDAGTFQFTAVPAQVPEPGALALLAAGFLALTLIRRRRG